MNKQLLTAITLGGFAFLLIIVFYGYNQYQSQKVDQEKDQKTMVTNFEECVAAGNPVMESFPEQCRHGGVTYTRNIGNVLEKTDLIRITQPQPGDVISSPLTVTGEARGTWYFEADFPVTVEDSEGNVLGEGFVQAQDEWMTEEFVSFEGTITFTADDVDEGRIIFHRANPSGLPENDDSLYFPVTFE